MTKDDKPGELVINSEELKKQWPEELKEQFLDLCINAWGTNISIIGILGLNLSDNTMSVFFSPNSSRNRYMAQMCDDISHMFAEIAKRNRQ